jgi:hypothetical protein
MAIAKSIAANGATVWRGRFTEVVDQLDSRRTGRSASPVFRADRQRLRATGRPMHCTAAGVVVISPQRQSAAHFFERREPFDVKAFIPAQMVNDSGTPGRRMKLGREHRGRTVGRSACPTLCYQHKIHREVQAIQYLTRRFPDSAADLAVTGGQELTGAYER